MRRFKRICGRDIYQKPEVRPVRNALVCKTGWGPEDERTDGIGLLAERVAEVVRLEILRFFQRGEG